MYQQHADLVESQALVAFEQTVIRNLPDSPEVNIGYVTPEYLSLLRSPLALGRHFSPDEGLHQQLAVTVISERLWQHLFQRSPEVIGKTLQLGAVSFRIIGVTSADFTEPAVIAPGQHTDLWLPWDFNPTWQLYKNWWGALAPDHHLLVKLRPGQQAAAVAQQLSTALNQRFKQETANSAYAQHFQQSSIRIELQPLAGAIRGDSAKPALLMLGGALLLLLIASGNISNLLLARAANQQQRLAIQLALGAQQRHLNQQFLAELAVLLSGSIALALVVAQAGIWGLQHIATAHLPRLPELNLYNPSLLLALLLMLLLCWLLAWLLSHQLNIRTLQQYLQHSGKGTGVQVAKNIRQWLLASQSALTVLLLVVCLQLLFAAGQQLQQPPGFQTRGIERIVLSHLDPAGKPPALAELLAIRQQLSEQPQVMAASLASSTLIQFNQQSVQDSLSHSLHSVDSIALESSYVDANYLPLLQARLSAGRHFSDAELIQSAAVVLINQTAARALEPDGNALDKFYYFNGDTRVQVIGIVQDFSLPAQTDPPRLWLADFFHFTPDLLLQYRADSRLNAIELNQLLAKISPDYKVQSIEPLTQLQARALFLPRLTLWLALSLALLSCSLAAIGIYGVVSYSVQLRRFELGVRMAIGARPVTVFLHILKDNLTPVVIGLAVALTALAGLWLWLQQSSFSLASSAFGWVIPVLLILGLTAATSLLSVWGIIRKPAVYALRGN